MTNPNHPSCYEYLGAHWTLLLQLALVTAGCASLAGKRRWLETTPRRERTAWLYDVAKQAAGDVLVVAVNAMATWVLASRIDHACSWFVYVVVVDATVLLAVVVATVLVADRLFRRSKRTYHLISGNYDSPPSRTRFLYQLLLFLGYVAFAKMVSTVVAVSVYPHVSSTIDAPISPFAGSRQWEIIVLMILLPLLCDMLRYWIVDQVIKLSKTTEQLHHEYAEEQELVHMLRDDVYGLDEDL